MAGKNNRKHGNNKVFCAKYKSNTVEAINKKRNIDRDHRNKVAARRRLSKWASKYGITISRDDRAKKVRKWVREKRGLKKIKAKSEPAAG